MYSKNWAYFFTIFIESTFSGGVADAIAHPSRLVGSGRFGWCGDGLGLFNWKVASAWLAMIGVAAT